MKNILIPIDFLEDACDALRLLDGSNANLYLLVQLDSRANEVPTFNSDLIP